jgi:undecaprenyl-diphosphatase
MTDTTLLSALVMGVVEGLTEFIPVSSTGHLILMGEILGFQGPPGRLFEVVIQLGAILAVCVVYFQRLFNIAVALPSSVAARRFVLAILLAFLPAVIIGVLAHGYIKSVLFSPTVVCTALIVGGVAILVLERILPQPRHFEVEAFSPKLALGIGLVQTMAMIPGVSRSGATILGALMMGVDRRTAAEFSFFLAIPTMTGAVVYDTYKNFSGLTSDGTLVIAIGFIAAFVSGMIVVRSLVAFVGRYGFTPFGWYRIALGGIGLVLLSMT